MVQSGSGGISSDVNVDRVRPFEKEIQRATAADRIAQHRRLGDETRGGFEMVSQRPAGGMPSGPGAPGREVGRRTPRRD